jgi:hypothetical protein
VNQLTEEIRRSLEEASSFEGIWGKIRQGLIDYYGLGSNAMDNAWFGKLTADVDSDTKKLTAFYALQLKLK